MTKLSTWSGGGWMGEVVAAAEATVSCTATHKGIAVTLLIFNINGVKDK